MDELIESNKAKRTDDNENNLAVGCHLLGFLIFVIPGVGHILGPLILWLAKREGNPFVDQQGKEAVNFQVSFTLWYLIAAGVATVLFWTLVVPILMGIVLLVLAVVWLVAMILAAVSASKGRAYRYPLTLRLIT